VASAAGISEACLYQQHNAAKNAKPALAAAENLQRGRAAKNSK